MKYFVEKSTYVRESRRCLKKSNYSSLNYFRKEFFSANEGLKAAPRWCFFLSSRKQLHFFQLPNWVQYFHRMDDEMRSIQSLQDTFLCHQLLN